jgi:hypothetical protein
MLGELAALLGPAGRVGVSHGSDVQANKERNKQRKPEKIKQA